MIYIMVILKMMGGEETSSGTINKMKRKKIRKGWARNPGSKEC